MPDRKKKVPWLFLVIGALISIWLGYLLNGAREASSGLADFPDMIKAVMNRPFANYYNSKTITAMGIALFAYTTAVVMYYTSRHNYMFGREYGSAKFADIRKVNERLASREENCNRILSRNVRLSYDTKATKLNNNLLIIGGSGAGKTFYEVKPNLMQLPKSSFICTDPKGEILRSCGGMLKQNGYNVKVINLVEMDESDCYNPFSYIREETDIVRLITNIISNTTPKGSNPPDPFWESATCS